MATQIPGVTLDTSVLDKITANIKPKASKVVMKWGWIMAREAATVHPWKLRTGALTDSILSESHMETDLLFILQDGVEYGIFLELGTSKMAAYPFVIPAIEHWRDPFLADFSKVFE